MTRKIINTKFFSSFAEEIELFQAIYKVIRRGDFVFGAEVFELEKRLATLLAMRHGIGVGNGTEAIIYALRALRIGLGDEVITTPYGCVPHVEAIIAVGAKPVFIDVRTASFRMDEWKIEERLTPDVKAILAVHPFGESIQLDHVGTITQRHALYLIEDIAQTFGAEWRGKKVGSFGAAACLSFHPGKPLSGIGEGGMVITNDEEMANLIRTLRNHGVQEPNDFHLNHIRVGGNGRLDTIQAAALLVRFAYWQERCRERQAVARLYHQHLKGIGDLNLPAPAEGYPSEHIYWQYVIRTSHAQGLTAWLIENEVTARRMYPVPIHLQPAYRFFGYSLGSFPNAEAAAREGIALPLIGDEVLKISETIQRFFKTHNSRNCACR